MVRAAGGVVVRDGLVLLVHRPAYDDWTLPKGKAEAGEDDLACALREVREETGLDCEPLRELASSEYRDGSGRPKRVRWWLLQPHTGAFEPTNEVDEVRWLEPGEASALLSYSSDRTLLEELG
jgi:8-oxo-dGTP diphosphatase